MKFNDYVEEERINICDMARVLGVHRNHLYFILRGARRPSIHLARRIQDLTFGKVTVDDLIEKEPDGGLRCPTCQRKLGRH